MNKKLSIRVYAIFQTEDGKVPVLREKYHDLELVKFPGGGMVWGEGVIDTLKRELYEELGMRDFSYELFFIYEKPIISIFNPEVSVVTIYYLVTSKENLSIGKQTPVKKDNSALLEILYLPLEESSCNQLTFENDRLALKTFLQRHQTQMRNTEC